MLRKSLEKYKGNVFEDLGKTWGIVTAGNKQTGFNCLTVSWGGFGVIWGKNVAYIFVRKSRYTYDFLENSDSVTISFLNDQYKAAKSIIGTKSGRDLDKMELAGLHYTYDPDFDGAYIKECDYCFKMKKLYSLDLPLDKLDSELKNRFYPDGDIHTMYVCEIKQFLIKEDL